MTELMKRYEKETGNSSTTIWRGECNVSNNYIEWLEAQLAWRPVAQKPDVDGLYVVTKRDESPRWDKSYHLVRFKNGEWKVDSFSGGYVYSYFNVPIPAPEGD